MNAKKMRDHAAEVSGQVEQAEELIEDALADVIAVRRGTRDGMRIFQAQDRMERALVQLRGEA